MTNEIDEANFREALRLLRPMCPQPDMQLFLDATERAIDERDSLRRGCASLRLELEDARTERDAARNALELSEAFKGPTRCAMHDGKWCELPASICAMHHDRIVAERDLAAAERDEFARQRDRAAEALMAAEREADRLRHGAPVEGDFVCPNELALREARGQVAALRAELENALRGADHSINCRTNDAIDDATPLACDCWLQQARGVLTDTAQAAAEHDARVRREALEGAALAVDGMAAFDVDVEHSHHDYYSNRWLTFAGMRLNVPELGALTPAELQKVANALNELMRSTARSWRSLAAQDAKGAR